VALDLERVDRPPAGDVYNQRRRPDEGGERVAKGKNMQKEKKKPKQKKK
jgi:hypothetical protein